MPTRPARVSRAETLFAEHYEHGARYRGDEDPKKASAAAKRTATSLNGALSTFGALLPPDQRAALQTAAVAMRDLASDLDAACRLAKQRKVDYERDELAKRNARSDDLALERWGGSDEAMLAEAAELAAFVDTWFELDVQTWVLSTRKPHLQYAHLECLPRGGRLLDMLARRTSQPPGDLTVLRRRAAEYLGMLADSMRYARVVGRTYTVALDDFEAWCGWRAAVRAAIVPQQIGKAGNCV